MSEDRNAWLTDDMIAEMVTQPDQPTGVVRLGRTQGGGGSERAVRVEREGVEVSSGISEEKYQVRPRTTYPWDRWFDGQLHVLTQGKDFATKLDVFRVTVANTAKRQEKYVLTQKVSDRTLLVQAFDTREQLETARQAE